MRWARTKWLAYFSSPLLPMLGVALAVLPIVVLGLLMMIANFLAVLAALFLWPLALVAGFVMAILLAGVLLGWPLMWATISVEGTDSFDALNRTYAYVFQRPIRYFFYVIVAALIGWLGWFVVENLRRVGHFLGSQLGRGIGTNAGVDVRLRRRGPRRR